METDIVIVGGGAAGLSTAGALVKLGLRSVVLEQDSYVGGTWARRYDRLHLHTIRQLSGLAHYPIPRRLPRYLPRDVFVRYLRSYVRRLGLEVVVGCKVTSISPGSEDGVDGWTVETNQGTWRCRVVVIATGQYRVPQIPDWPGKDSYQGHLMHSVDYRHGGAWVGKRALVIGVGNSGAEIATDLAGAGASLAAISIRTPPFLTARDTFGLPVQLIGFALGVLPPRAADRIAALTSRLRFGDMRRHGLATAGYAPFSAQRVPLIDVGFASALKKGRVAVRPDVASLTPTGVVFDDGREEPFDLIVAATGFRTDLERLLPLPNLLDPTGYPLTPSGEPTPYPGLYFIGFTHSLHGHLYEANKASRRLARHIATYLSE